LLKVLLLGALCGCYVPDRITSNLRGRWEEFRRRDTEFSSEEEEQKSSKTEEGNEFEEFVRNRMLASLRGGGGELGNLKP
jgi:hypothetical protein